MSVQKDFKKKNKPINVKAVFDVVMGLLYGGIGAFLAAAKYIGWEHNFPQPYVTIFGIAAIIYGAFRIFRGIKTYNEV